MSISLPKRVIRPAAATPHSVGELLRHHMGLIAELFDAPKMTLVIRSPTLDGDLIITNDEAADAITAIKKYCERHSTSAAIRLDS